MSRAKKWNLDDPEFRMAVEQVKKEIALEYGIQIPRDGYWGHLQSREIGRLGSQLKKRVGQLEELFLIKKRN